MSFEQASVTVVADYVRRLQLSGFTFTDYADILERERINGKVFLALTLDGFNSIGIIDYPRRKLFHQHIELLRSQHNSPGSTTSNSLHNNTTIRFKLEPTQPTNTISVTPKLELQQTIRDITPCSMTKIPNGPSTQNMKHQEFNEAIGRLLSTNTLNLNLPPFPILPSMSTSFEPMGGTMKRPFTSMSSDASGSTVSLHSLHNAKRPKLNDSFHSGFKCIDSKFTVTPQAETDIDTKRGRFKVTTTSTKKKKGTTRYTYRRWTEEENVMMRELCGNQEQSRIDWTMIQREKMPYRTICGIRQHWENMQKRDRAQHGQVSVTQSRSDSTDAMESRKALYESDNSSDEDEDSHEETHSEDDDDAQGEHGQTEHVTEERVKMPKLTE